MTSTSTEESFDSSSEVSLIDDDSSDLLLESTTDTSDKSSVYHSNEAGEESFRTSVDDETSSALNYPLSSEETEEGSAFSVCETNIYNGRKGIFRGKKVFSAILVSILLLVIVSIIISIVIYIGGWNNVTLTKKYHFIECSLKDTRYCDSGEHNTLGDMESGFITFNDKDESFLIVFSDENEYVKLFSQLEDYKNEVRPSMASNAYGGYGGYDQGSDYTNMEYLGTGYDVFTANPLFSAGVDNGFRMSIFDMQMGTADAKNSLSCDLDFDVYVMDSDNKLRDTRHNVIKINHKQSRTSSRQQYDYDEYDGESPAGQKSSFSLPTFSLSHDNLKTVMKITTKNRVYAITSTECEIYRMNLIKFNHPPPTPSFQSAVDSMMDMPWIELSEEEKALYIDFVEAFGTHVVTKAHMGAKFSYEYEMNKYYYQKEDTHNVANTLKVLGIDATMINNQKTEDTLDDLIVNMRLLSVGARPIYSMDRTNNPDEKERDKAELWASNAEINPLPIHYEVTPISEYYYYEMGMRVKLLDGMFKADNLEKAIHEYYHRSKEFIDQHPRYLEKCEMKDGKAMKFGDLRCLGSPSNDEKLEWWAARQKCQLWGGDLVVVDDRLKNYFVSENFQSQGSWIGYYYVNKVVPNKEMLSNGAVGWDEDSEEEKKKKKKKGDDEEKYINARMMKWVNGEPKGFESFYEDQPDGGGDRSLKKKKKAKKRTKNAYKNDDEFCIQTNYKDTSSWADSNCRDRLQYVCERPLYPPQSNYYTSADSDEEGSMMTVRREKDCRDGVEFQGYCYRHFREGMDWGSAKFECTRWVPVSWGGKLAVVKSEEVSSFLKNELLMKNREQDISDFATEYQKLYEKITNEGSGDLQAATMRKYVWIGLTDIAEEGVWKWEDGIYLGTYRNFDTSVRMKKRDNYDCAAMKKDNGMWVYGDCNVMRHEFVCQYKM